MIRAIIIKTLLLICVQHAVAQISGRVVNEANEAIPFATVQLLLKADSTPVAGLLTDDTGNFRIDKVKPGTMFAVVRSVGYQAQYLLSFVIDNNAAPVDLGKVILINDVQHLEEVSVTAQRAVNEQRQEGTIMNVERSVMSQGSSVLQILERAPGVTMDAQRGGIMLNGKEGVMILINGKPMRMPVDQVFSILSGTSGNNVSRIELLTTPPAGYDAEGSGGVINIILKKNTADGTNGSVSAGVGLGYREKANASVNLNHARGANNIYGSYSFSHDRNIGYFYAVGSEQEPLLGGHAQSEFLSTTRPNQNNHNASLGIDRQLTDRTGVSAAINYTNTGSANHTENFGTYHLDNDSVYHLEATTTGVNQWNSVISNVSMNHQLREGERLSIDADYLHFKNDYPTASYNTFLSERGFPAGSNDTLFSPSAAGTSKTLIQVAIAKMDYSRQFRRGLTAEAGWKGTYTRTTSSSFVENLLDGNYVARPAAVNRLRMGEVIAAGYASVNARLDSGLNLVAGVRYEYSNTQIDNVLNGTNVISRKISKLFPNVTLTKELAGRSKFYISYTRRIGRPSFSDLASFVTYGGPMSINSGNPFLKPTITDNLKIGIDYHGYGLSVLLSHDAAPIARYQSVYTSDRLQLNISPQNLVYQNNLTFQLDAPITITRWWDLSLTALAGWRRFHLTYTQEPTEHTYFGGSFTGSSVFRLPAAFALELSGFVNGLAYNGSRKVDPYGVLNAGIRKELSRGRGTFQFTVSDMLMTNAVSSYFGALTREAFDLTTHVQYHNESADYLLMRLTFTRSFGRGAKSERTNSGIQSERERIN
jgi:outer membrane receptor protein involved in Fe transport